MIGVTPKITEKDEKDNIAFTGFYLKERAAPGKCFCMRRPLLRDLLKYWGLDTATMGELEEDVSGVTATWQTGHGDGDLTRTSRDPVSAKRHI